MSVGTASEWSAKLAVRLFDRKVINTCAGASDRSHRTPNSHLRISETSSLDPRGIHSESNEYTILVISQSSVGFSYSFDSLRRTLILLSNCQLTLFVAAYPSGGGHTPGFEVRPMLSPSPLLSIARICPLFRSRPVAWTGMWRNFLVGPHIRAFMGYLAWRLVPFCNRLEIV